MVAFGRSLTLALGDTPAIVTRMPRYARIASVTLGLVGAGAAFGAVASATALTLLMLVGLLRRGVPVDFFDLWPILIAGAVGAGFGAVLGPGAAWLLLRRAPLGRALRGATVGTVAGALIGATLPPVPLPGPIWGAVAGFVAACVWLR